MDGPTAARILGMRDRSFRTFVAGGGLEKVTLCERIIRYRVEDIRAIAAPHPAAWPARVANPEPTPPAGGARPHRIASGRRAR